MPGKKSPYKPFSEVTKNVPRIIFQCTLTGEAKDIVIDEQTEFQNKYCKGKDQIELGKGRAVQFLLEELAERRAKDAQAKDAAA